MTPSAPIFRARSSVASRSCEAMIPIYEEWIKKVYFDQDGFQCVEAGDDILLTAGVPHQADTPGLARQGTQTGADLQVKLRQ